MQISYGVIPLQKRDGKWVVFLIQHHAGHWGFPKGHPEKEEGPQEVATRELLEETGLQVKHWLSDQTFQESYHFTYRGKPIFKKVFYFVAEVEGEERLQKEEILSSRWVLLSEASHYLTFSEGKAICQKTIELLNRK